MNLIYNWKALAPKLWSIRLALLAAGLGVVEMTLPLFQSFFPPLWFGGASVLIGFASAFARIVAQPKAHIEAEQQ